MTVAGAVCRAQAAVSVWSSTHLPDDVLAASNRHLSTLQLILGPHLLTAVDKAGKPGDGQAAHTQAKLLISSLGGTHGTAPLSHYHSRTT